MYASIMWLASMTFSSFGRTPLIHETSTSSITFWLASLHSVISICEQIFGRQSQIPSRLLELNQPASFEELLAVGEGRYRCGLALKPNNRSNSALGCNQTFSLVAPVCRRFTDWNFKQLRLSPIPTFKIICCMRFTWRKTSCTGHLHSTHMEWWSLGGSPGNCCYLGFSPV